MARALIWDGLQGANRSHGGSYGGGFATPQTAQSRDARRAWNLFSIALSKRASNGQPSPARARRHAKSATLHHWTLLAARHLKPFQVRCRPLAVLPCVAWVKQWVEKQKRPGSRLFARFVVERRSAIDRFSHSSHRISIDRNERHWRRARVATLLTIS